MALLTVPVVAVMALAAVAALRRDTAGRATAVRRARAVHHQANVHLERVDTQLSIDTAQLAILSLPGISRSTFEHFPFRTQLPTITVGRIRFPGDEPGVVPFEEWKPADGFAANVEIASLPVGRFVVVPAATNRFCDGPTWIAPGTRNAIVGICARLGSALAQDHAYERLLFDTTSSEG